MSASQVMKASELKGKTVESQTGGEKLGTVNDMVIDTQTAQLNFVIIASGGIAGIGSDLKIVPPMALSTATAKKGVLALDVGPEPWKSAPGFTKDQLSNLNNPMQAQKIYQFYHQEWPAMASGTNRGTQPLSPTGRNTAPAGQLSLASDLMGKRVVNSQNQDMGKITDLLVQLKNPKPTFAILKPGSFITDANKEAGKEYFAIPVSAFKASSESNKEILDVDPSQFQQAQPLTESSLSMAAAAAAGSPQVFRYDPDSSLTGVPPDNTRVNSRDRQAGSVTPTDQSESQDDLRLTQSIRQAVVKDSSLSTMAKNVKIVTANGKVTLRGPVHTDQEKTEIERIAQQAAGTGNVQSELEVKGN